MKWLFTSKKSKQEIYELWNTEEKLLALTFQPGSGSLRIAADNEKRVFLIGREGFLRARIVLRNEYGIRIAQLNYETGQDKIGTIEFDDGRFNYDIRNHVRPELVITKNEETIVSCELPEGPKNSFDIENQDFLILALCWYVFTVIKKHREEYA